MQEHKNPKEDEQVSVEDESSFAAGHMLGGKYKIISLLGAGGMGKVYWVSQVFLDTDFALKVLDIHRVFDDVQMRRFQFEAKAANSLSHPSLVKVHDFGLLDNNQPYLVMDLVEGETLAERIRKQGELSFQEAAPLFEQICSGLAYAHEKGIVHRDIKPSNIILVADTHLGTEGSVKILDFGIAKLASEEGGEVQQLTRTGEVFGSPLYMSPEQCSGAPVDHRSDIYSLGCVLFEALTGTPPHMGANALRTMMLHQTEPAPLLRQASLGKSFPAALEDIVSKMLQKDPSARYQNMTLIADDLESVLTNKKIAKAKVSNATATKAPRLITMSSDKFYLLLFATILITAGITLAVSGSMGANWHALFHQVSNTSILAKAPASERENLADIDFFKSAGATYQDPHAEATKLLFDNCHEVKSERQLDENGNKVRRFVFPERALGTISCRINSHASNNTNNQKTGTDIRKTSKERYLERDARGIVYMPDVPLMLHISGKRCPEIFQLASFIEKINPNEFSGLEISSNIIAEQNLQIKGLEKILSIASAWKDLDSVSLIGLSVSKKAILTLGKIKKLSTISFESPHVDAKFLCAQPFWDRVSSVTLKHMSAAEVVSRLSHSANLETLNLIDTRVSPSTVELLQTCKNLNYLTLEDRVVSSGVLNSVAELKGLRTLRLKHVALDQEQFKLLSKMPRLKHIVLSPLSIPSMRSMGYSDQRIKFADEDDQI